MKIGVERYPSCRYTHAALDALIAMRREQSDAGPDQARRDRTHRNGVTLTGDAATSGIRPRSSADSSRCSSPAPWRWTRAASAGTITAARRRGRGCAGRQVRRGAGRSPRSRPQPPVGARVSITTDDGVHERLYADPSGEPTRSRTRRRCSRSFSPSPARCCTVSPISSPTRSCRWSEFDRVAKATQSGGSRRSDAIHLSRRVTDTSARWPNSSISRSFSAPAAAPRPATRRSRDRCNR